MGLTVHYKIQVKDPAAKPLPLVRAMREVFLDLPFQKVGDVIDLRGRAADYTQVANDDPNRWLLIQAGESVYLPWNKGRSWRVSPTRVVAFESDPGDGCEPANVGLCRFPEAVPVEYDPRDDARFELVERTEHSTRWLGFSWEKWDRYCKRTYGERFPTERFKETRMLPTGISGWHWSSFCKTQYADDPALGGLPHFLRCHIALVTALERVGKIPDVRVTINDEGHYGRARYSDDWKEAMAGGLEATYVWHKATHDPRVLAAQVGESAAMLAAFFGGLKDVLAGTGTEVVAPIAARSDFEHLEARGLENGHVKEFLGVLGQAAEKARAANPATEDRPK